MRDLRRDVRLQLILLPPSEGKAIGGSGPSVDLAALAFPSLAPMRARVLAALAATSSRPDALAVLGAPPGATRSVANNVDVASAPTLPAGRRYTGVLYDALDLTSLTPAARRRAEASIVISSALFGAVRIGDAIPAYRLSMDVDLPGVGPLAAAWRPVLGPVLAEAAGDGLVIDCRSSVYAASWRAPAAIASRVLAVRVLREQDGRRSIVSHMAKQTRGAVARCLLSSRRSFRRPADVAAALRTAFEVELTPPTRAGSQWALDVVLRD